MRLHENKELFQDAVIATAQQKGLSETIIEKDYWVTVALYPRSGSIYFKQPQILY
jgi:hypothetical protein